MVQEVTFSRRQGKIRGKEVIGDWGRCGKSVQAVDKMLFKLLGKEPSREETVDYLYICVWHGKQQDHLTIGCHSIVNIRGKANKQASFALFIVNAFLFVHHSTSTQASTALLTYPWIFPQVPWKNHCATIRYKRWSLIEKGAHQTICPCYSCVIGVHIQEDRLFVWTHNLYGSLFVHY